MLHFCVRDHLLTYVTQSLKISEYSEMDSTDDMEAMSPFSKEDSFIA